MLSMLALAGSAFAEAPALQPADLKTWKGEVAAAAAAADPARFAEAVRRAAPSFQPADGVPFARVDVFSGQLDDDAAREWVVQVIQAPPAAEGAGERVEHFWVGVLDQEASGLRLVGEIAREVWHCNWDDRPWGLTFGFASERPGPDAKLVLVEQLTEACGTLVRFEVRTTPYRVAGGSLVADPATVTPGMSYDRMALPE